MFQQPTIQTPLADKLKTIELKNDLSDVFKKGLLYFNDSPNNTDNRTTSLQKIQQKILLCRLVKEDLPLEIEEKVNYNKIDDSIKKMSKLPDEVLHQLFVPDILLNVKRTLTLDQKEMIEDIKEKEINEDDQNQFDYPNNYYIYKLCCGCVDLDRIDEFADTLRKD